MKYKCKGKELYVLQTQICSVYILWGNEMAALKRADQEGTPESSVELCRSAKL